jgi:hypothetical protein
MGSEKYIRLPFSASIQLWHGSKSYRGPGAKVSIFKEPAPMRWRILAHLICKVHTR